MVYCFGYNYVLMWLERGWVTNAQIDLFYSSLISLSLSFSLFIQVFVSFSYENILFFMPLSRIVSLRFDSGSGVKSVASCPLCTDFALLAYFRAASAASAASAIAHCALFAFNIYAKRFSLIWDSIRTFQLAKLSGRNDFWPLNG